jgi:hypothetical protein
VPTVALSASQELAQFAISEEVKIHAAALRLT